MKNHLRLVASNDDQAQLHRDNRERLRAHVRSASGIVAPVLRALRFVLYLVLLFLRIPVQVVCRLAIVPLLVFAAVWGFLKGWASMPVLVMAGGAFGLFLFGYLYDSLLLIVAPERVYLSS